MVQLFNESSYQLNVKVTKRSMPTGNGDWIPVGPGSRDDWGRWGQESIFIVSQHGWLGFTVQHNGVIWVRDDGVHFVQEWDDNRHNKSIHRFFQNAINYQDIAGWDATPGEILEKCIQLGATVAAI